MNLSKLYIDDNASQELKKKIELENKLWSTLLLHQFSVHFSLLVMYQHSSTSNVGLIAHILFGAWLIFSMMIMALFVLFDRPPA